MKTTRTALVKRKALEDLFIALVSDFDQNALLKIRIRIEEQCDKRAERRERESIIRECEQTDEMP